MPFHQALLVRGVVSPRYRHFFVYFWCRQRTVSIINVQLYDTLLFSCFFFFYNSKNHFTISTLLPHTLFMNVFTVTTSTTRRCVCDERSRIYMLPVCGEIPNEMLSLRAKRLAGIRMTNKMEKMLRHVWFPLISVPTEHDSRTYNVRVVENYFCR